MAFDRQVADFSYRKAPFPNAAGVFKFLHFKERFRNPLFSWQIDVDGRLKCWSKLREYHVVSETVRNCCQLQIRSPLPCTMTWRFSNAIISFLNIIIVELQVMWSRVHQEFGCNVTSFSTCAFFYSCMLFSSGFTQRNLTEHSAADGILSSWFISNLNAINFKNLIMTSL